MTFKKEKDNVEALEDRILKKGISPSWLSKELNNLNSVTEKLEFLKSTHESKVENEEYVDTIHTMVLKTEDEHFPNTQDVNFSNWFLRYNAGVIFNAHITSLEFKEDTEGPESENYIRGELMNIKVEEEEARLLAQTHLIDSRQTNKPRNGFLYQKNYQYVEVHRILRGHYNNKPIAHPYTAIKSPEVKAYFRHNLLKPHLENLLKGHPEKIPESKTMKFEDLFFQRNDGEICLSVLRDLEFDVIDKDNNYIGRKKKGVFPLWIKLLKNHHPKPLIKHYPDLVYRNILNKKIKRLNLSKDASEFRKVYKNLEISGVENDIRVKLSQLF